MGNLSPVSVEREGGARMGGLLQGLPTLPTALRSRQKPDRQGGTRVLFIKSMRKGPEREGRESPVEAAEK